MARIFGITTTLSGINGVVLQSLSTDASVETAEARNTSGMITDQIAYSRKKTVSMEALVDGTNTVQAGDVIQIGGKDYLVESANRSETNTDYQKISITASRGDEATITAYPTTNA